MQLNSGLFGNIANFIKRRLIEFFGLILITFFFLYTFALVNYSAEGSTLIYKADNSATPSIFYYYSNVVADFFLQSFGLISFLIGISIFSWGINLIIGKKIPNILSGFFYIVTYIFFGCLFVYSGYNNSFWLSANGNGGFVGKFIFNSFFKSLIIFDEKISYYLLIVIVLVLFLISINFSLKFLKKIFNFKNKNIIKNNYENFNTEKKDFSHDTTRIQEDFSFEKNLQSKNNQKIKFKIPSIDFLNYPNKKERTKSTSDLNYDEKSLEKILLDFGVEGKIKKVSHGPVVTLNEFEPAAGIKVSKVINLSEDIARNTSSESARISTIPGRSTIGIELPNNSRENVYLSEIISSSEFSKKEIKLPIALGKSISGIPITGDLTSMPHLLIAGTTGSGKSVCINTIILSLLYKHSPNKCKFILIDPKMLELSTYEGIPHLLCPVITEAKKAASVLGWVVKEMESRYKLMTKEGVRNIDGYNAKHTLPMPYIVVIVDEMSDLMLVAGKEIENYIQKLSQMARAAGIHIIMATQRPSVDVITGTIKANFPTRISFQVSSKIDSRTILGEQGAEQLLGKGDMLFMSAANKIIRIHAPFVSETEIEKVNNFLRKQAEPDYVDEILNFADEKIVITLLLAMATKIIYTQRQWT